ncbi:MAG: HAD family hydrolase [Desulforegulaceae bacterium]|nr:HAD family hydrolase [Desulforegulaceae bacterium]
MNSLQNITTIVFDCDGVMFQTEELNRQYYNAILKRLNLPPMTDSQSEFVKMHTGEDSIKHLFENHNIDPKLIQKERKRVPYIDFVPYMEMTENFMELLNFLKNNNFKTGIATNRSNTMDRVMEVFNLNPYFDILVTASDVENPKPHPEQLIKIKNELKIKFKNMLYIGDSPLDQIAAFKAEVKFIAFCNEKLEADFHVSKMMEIKNLLEGKS